MTSARQKVLSKRSDRDLGFRIGTAIHRLRQRKQLTQLELAKRVGITQAAVSQIERGVRVNNLAILESIGTILGFRLSDLFRFAEEIEEEMLRDKADQVLRDLRPDEWVSTDAVKRAFRL